MVTTGDRGLDGRAGVVEPIGTLLKTRGALSPSSPQPTESKLEVRANFRWVYPGSCCSCFDKPVLSIVEGLSTSGFFLRRGVCPLALSLSKGERVRQKQVKTALTLLGAPPVRLSQNFNICSTNFTDGVGSRRYFSCK